jgi:hypothetical protein
MHGELGVPFKAVVLRYSYDVVTDEWLNLGVVLVCPARHFIGFQFIPSFSRITAAFPRADAVHLRRLCGVIEDRCLELQARASTEFDFDNDPFSLLGSILPVDDSGLRFSEPFHGLCVNPNETLAAQFERYVMRSVETKKRTGRHEVDVWRDFAARLSDARVLRSLTSVTLAHRDYKLEFEHAWKNGHWNAVQPVAFDLLDPNQIREKATAWAGKLLTVRPRSQSVDVLLLIGLPAPDRSGEIRRAANDGVAILMDLLQDEADVVHENEVDAVIMKMMHDLMPDSSTK